MKSLKSLLWIITPLLLLASCKQEDTFSLDFSQTGYYFKWGGDAVTITYGSTNVINVEMKKISEDWQCSVDHASRTITITPPADPGSEEKRNELRTGTLTLTATSEKGGTSTYALTLYIIGDNEILLNEDGKYANCYVASQPVTVYTLDVSCDGGGNPLPTIDDVKILWQSVSGAIKNVAYNASDKTVSFFIDGDDNDEETNDNNLYAQEANAVLAAYDASDNIIWSWHIWIVKSNEESPLNDHSTYTGEDGKTITFMNRNLGAFANHKGESEDTDLIHRSYGLYYQWGRKDPFPRPNSYNCAGGDFESLYTSSGSIVYIAAEETSATNGNVAYTIAHPMTFLTNAACVDESGDGVGDWMNSSDSNLWNDSQKSAYDPCPYGWRVPRSSDFDVLTLSETEDSTDLEIARKRYGWNLTDKSGNTFFYLGGGFCSYYNGKIVNMNYVDENIYPSTPEPWEGYYWTSGTTTDGKQSTCMYFDLKTTRTTINKFHLNYPSKRSNGMQIRCVKVE